MNIKSLYYLTFILAFAGLFAACDDPTKPNLTPKYTVNFEANGGNPAPQRQAISQGGKATEPAVMTKTGYGFGGWYKEATLINLWNLSTDVVTGNTTLYAKWDSNYHTVSFAANGGNPTPQQQNIAHGGKVIKPQDMSKAGFKFEGWHKETGFHNLWNFNSDTVTENIVLWAKWEFLVHPTIVQGTTLADKLQWLAFNAASNTNYLLEVSSDAFLNPHTLSYSGKSNITIQLTGIGSVRTVELYGPGSLFTINNGVTLVLDENIVLKGMTNNTAPLVMVNGGSLILNYGSKITGNHISSFGGGVNINSGAFTMNGGEISGNSSSSSGGGVYVNSGTFTMTDGEISGNSSSSSGGGVYVNSGIFTMTGGKVSGNSSSSSGGGVYINRGIFTMAGGEISGNTASYYGGGVYVGAVINSEFKKTGGIITGYSSDTENGNRSYYKGHAVYAEHSDSRFIRYKEFTAGQQNNLTYIRNEPSPPIMNGDWNLPVPEAPDVPVVILSSGSLTLQWTTVERALAYEVWLGTTNNSAHAEKRADVLGVSATLTDLTIGTTYYVWLKAKNDTGTSGFSPMASGKPIGNMGTVTVSTGGSGQLVLSWSAIVEADQYEVYYNTSESIPASPAQTVSTTTATISGLTNGTTYYVWVKPKNANGTGNASTIVSGTPMAMPSNLTVSPANQQLTVNWAAVSGAASYEIYQNTSTTIPASPSFTVTETSRTITGLTNGTTYYLWVKAVNANGTSATTPMASGKPIGNMGAVTLTTSGSGQLVLSWATVAGADQYEVYYNATNTIPSNSAQTVSTTTATISGLTNGTTYYVWLKGKNSSGTGNASTVTSGKPIGNMGAVTLTPSGSGQLVLSWSIVAGADQYEVYHNTSNLILASPAQTVSGTTATINGLTNGTTYYVWVKPKNVHGSGNVSTVVNGKPIGNMGIVTLTTGGSGQLVLSWSVVTGADQYEVYYSTVNTIPSNSAQTVSTTTATVSGLVNGTIYYVWVRPKNTNGTGNASQMASGKPTGVGLYKGAISDNNKIGNHNLSQALTFISSNAVSGDNFYIVLGADESAFPTSLNYSGKTVGITLIGEGGEQKITLASNGSMFTINTGVTLTLDENITLVGLSTNNRSLVYLDSGELIINAGAKISGNTTSSGGGIDVYGGTVTMNGGTISGNTSSNAGGGIYVNSNGILTMNGGKISGNTASYGGGILVTGTVTMNGGTISENSGSGIYVSGTGSGNITMNGGTISRNTGNRGGGIYADNNGTIIMHGGIISGNTASGSYEGGGGIYVDLSASFKKLPSGDEQNSGIIYGNGETGVDAGGAPLRNYASSSGHAVYSSSAMRNTTAGQTDHIDTTTGRGLSANGNPPFGQ